MLYDAFGEREIATTYTAAQPVLRRHGGRPELLAEPGGPLGHLRVLQQRRGGPARRIHALCQAATAPLAVNHSGVFPSVTLSFNLAPGVALGDAVKFDQCRREAGRACRARSPARSAGRRRPSQASLANEPLLIAAALAAVYIVLGILYESYIHPITILSTLPSAGVGALLALLITHTELSVIALIGIILLIGIVKKNAIMMIDFALEVERREHKSAKEAVFQACLLRFRPIMMTTMAALLGGLPLALGSGMGSELRRPLGITIVGGLIVSQALTLYTTPVIYLYMDRLNTWVGKLHLKRPATEAEALASTVV